jgi:hypothetical protein
MSTSFDSEEGAPAVLMEAALAVNADLQAGGSLRAPTGGDSLEGASGIGSEKSSSASSSW